MSLFRTRGANGPVIPIWQGLPMRMPRRAGSVDVTKDSSLTHSAVWAAQTLRADLVSTMPLIVWRKMPDGLEVTVPPSGVLQQPSAHAEGQPIDITEWLYSSQMDLDSTGNAFGIVTERDSMGIASQIDLVAADTVTVSVRNSRIQSYKIGKDTYSPADVWHERQYTVPGLHVGLSPVSYAARGIGASLSAQQFALDWFANGAVPSAILKNKDRTLQQSEATALKKQFQATLASGEVFVSGKDWDYQMVSAKAAEAEFLTTMEFSIVEVARWFGVPADMIDGAAKGANITYANITQRNLQFLITKLGPAVRRREAALTRLTPKPRRVALDTESLLRLDPLTLAQVLNTRAMARNLAPDEARAQYYNLPPLTEAQKADFKTLFMKTTDAIKQEGPAPDGADLATDEEVEP
jgi:HK97 family phage portal protein